MGNLDQELERAISESEQQAREQEARGPVVGETQGPRSPRARRTWPLLVALLVIGGAIFGLVFSSAEDAAVYSVSADQLLKNASEYTGRNVRVEGALVKGTLRHRAEPCEYRFDMEKNGATLSVRYPECIVPDTFRDMPGMDVLVTAEGKWNAAGHFDASHIMAKCPSKYEMEQRAKQGQTAPHAGLAAPTPAVANAL